MDAPPSVSRNEHVTPGEQARFERFLAALGHQGLSPTTCACYASDWWNLSQHFHETRRRPFAIERYGPDEFLEYRAHAATQDVSPATLNRRLAFLRRYAAAVTGRAHVFDRIPWQPVLRPATRALLPDEEARFVAAAAEAEPADRALAILLLGTGLRASEAVALQVGDLEGPRGQPERVRVRAPRPKTVVLPPEAGRLLGALATGGAQTPLFRSAGGEDWSEAQAVHAVARVAQAAGVEATPRTLRHTFAVRYLREHRDDLRGLAHALGQQSLSAARVYREEANAEVPKVRHVAWEDLEEESLAPLVSRRVVRGGRLEAVRYVYRPGASFPVHSHPEEQMTFVLSGRVEMQVGDRRIEVGAGEVVLIPPHAPHGLQVLGARAATTLNVFTPTRKVLPDARSA